VGHKQTRVLSLFLCQRLGDFASVLDEKLRDRAERAILRATPIGMRARGSLMGNILNSLRLVGNLNMEEAGIIVRNRPVATRLIRISAGSVNTVACG